VRGVPDVGMTSHARQREGSACVYLRVMLKGLKVTLPAPTPVD